MKCRIIATAIAKKDWTSVEKKGKGYQKSGSNFWKILTNPINWNKRRFDNDDMYTIDMLKGAFSKLKNYSVDCLTKYDTLFGKEER